MISKDPMPLEVCQLVSGLQTGARASFRRLWCPSDLAARPRDLQKLRELSLSVPTQNTSSTAGPATQLQAYAQILQRTNWDVVTDECKIHNINYEHAARLALIFWNCCFKIQVGDETVSGIFLGAARLNHSCVPNCHVSWNRHRGELCVHSIRDIAKDEELLITYDADEVLFRGRRDRMQMLRERYGFECDCPACDLSTDFGRQADSVRETIAGLVNQLSSYSPAGDANSLGLISLYVYLITLIQSQGLETEQKAKL